MCLDITAGNEEGDQGAGGRRMQSLRIEPFQKYYLGTRLYMNSQTRFARSHRFLDKNGETEGQLQNSVYTYLRAYMQSISWEIISERVSFFWRHSVIESLSGW